MRLADTDRQSVFRSELLLQVLYSVRSERMLTVLRARVARSRVRYRRHLLTRNDATTRLLTVFLSNDCDRLFRARADVVDNDASGADSRLRVGRAQPIQ